MAQEVPNNPRISALDNCGIIRVSGSDAANFLQGQFGNDLTLINNQRNQLNCYSNPKGRLLTIFRVFMRGDDYYLRMPLELVASTLNRLKMFVLMAKVNIEDVSQTTTSWGVAGAEAKQFIADVFGHPPENVNDSISTDSTSVLRIPGVLPRFEIHTDSDQAEAVFGQLQQHFQISSEDTWAHDDILAGIPTIYQATHEEFVAQMTNLQLIDGLSFKKGCYPGQEIVARMHYLGKLKRRMFLARIEGNTVPAPGTDVFAGDKNAGKVADARMPDSQPARALLVLNIASAENGNLHLATPDGPTLTIEQLPYPFEADQ